METSPYRLETTWQRDGGPHGRFTFTLFNLSDFALSDFRLVYTSLTRVIDPEACENAVFLRRNANFHEFAPPPGNPSITNKMRIVISPDPDKGKAAGWRGARWCRP